MDKFDTIAIALMVVILVVIIGASVWYPTETSVGTVEVATGEISGEGEPVASPEEATAPPESEETTPAEETTEETEEPVVEGTEETEESTGSTVDLVAGSLPAGEFPGQENKTITAYFEVDIHDNEITPDLVEGASPINVRWTNQGEHMHRLRISSYNRGIYSDRLMPGESWNYTFYGPAVYNYVDTSSYIYGKVRVSD